MSSTGSGSLREHYAVPPPSWSFVPSENFNASTSNIPRLQVEKEPSFQWSTRPRQNSIYDLSPDLDFEPNGPNAIALLRTAAASMILQYLSAALENPFEVGKTLLQIQYIPRDITPVDEPEAVQDEEETSDDTSSADNEDTYFVDDPESSSRINTPRPTDERGYIVRTNVADSATRPDWVMPQGTVTGAWGMIKQLTRWKPEGLLALWKGTLTGCIKTFLESSLQPVISTMLTNLLSVLTGSSPSVFTRSHPLLLPVLTNVTTGFLLSPLDLIRTRLIAQTSVSHYRRYSGPFDALNKILLEEGGFQGLYLHPQLLIPTILESVVTPLAAALGPAFVARLLSRLFGAGSSHGPGSSSLMGPGGLADDTHPLLWSIAQLGGACATLLVTLPIETVRRRLQVQTRGAAAPLRTCVEIRRKQYVGVVDAMYSILTEERSDIPIRSHRRHKKSSKIGGKGKGKEREVTEVEFVENAGEDERDIENGSWLGNTGVRQLYRGFGVRAGASVLIFLLSLLVSESSEGSGWTEL